MPEGSNPYLDAIQQPAAAPEGANPYLSAIAPKDETPVPRSAASMGQRFWDKLTEGGVQKFLSETLPGEVGTRLHDVRSAEAEFAANNEWDKERARRKAAGESLNGMEQWKLQRINEIVASKKPQTGETPSMGDIFKGVVKAAVDDPGGFGATMFRGLVAHPELMLTPEALPAKMAAVAGKIGKTAAEAGQIGAAAAAESALTQLTEHGKVSGAQTAAEATSMVAPIVAGRMLAQWGVAKNAKGKNIEPSDALFKEAGDLIEKKIKDGVPLKQSVEESLNAVKVDPEVAAEAAKMMEPHVPEEPPKSAAPEAPKVDERAARLERGREEIGWAQEGGRLLRQQPEGTFQIGEGEVIGRTKWIPKSDLWPERPDKSLTAKQAHQALDKAAAGERLTPREQRFVDHVDRTIAERDHPYLEADAEARAEREAIQWEGTQYRGPEAGRVDPKLLIGLGITATGGALGYLYNKDPKDAIFGALATGGVLAAGALLKRGGSAVAEAIRDNSYRITDLTDRWAGDVDSARLANMRLAWQVKALVPKRAQREQLTHYLQGDTTIRLTPEMQQAAEAIDHYFKELGRRGQQAGILPADLLDNYVTQLWTGLNRNDPLLRNLMNSMGLKNLESHPGMAQRTRFAMQRVIPSYKEGMARGMVPTTLDIADIMRVYGDNIARTIANKNLFKTLENTRTPWGEALMVRDTPDAAIKQINRAAAIVDSQLEGGGEIGRDIRQFAISKAPRNYVPIDHPQMRGYKVHEDIAPVMKNLFDAKPNAVTNAAYALAVASKRAIFSYSMFHTKTLAEAMLGGGYGGMKALVTGAAWRELKQGQAGGVVDELVRGGLKVVDRPLEGDVTPFTNALKLLEERHPLLGKPAQAARAIQRGMDWVLWDVVQPTFKTALGMASMEKLLTRHPEMPRTEAAKLAASYTNDIFGGLDWFRMADGVQNKFGRELALAVTSPRGRQFMQIAMLAPDWTVATTRAMAKAVPGVTRPELARLHQGYVIRSLLLYATVADGLNLAFSGHHFWDNKDPTMVDLGDGRKLQLSKHIMEPIHWLISPGQQSLNKLGWVIKEPIEQGLNKQWLSTKGAPAITGKGDTALSGAGKRIEHAIGSMMPIPGQTAFQYGPAQAALGFLGLPVYGKSDTQAEDEARTKAKEKGKDPEREAQKLREKRRKQRMKEQGANP